MFKKSAALGLAFALMAAPMFAHEGDVPKGVPHLDHVFVIMMENHGYLQIVNNPTMPFINGLISKGKVNLATEPFSDATEATAGPLGAERMTVAFGAG